VSSDINFISELFGNLVQHSHYARPIDINNAFWCFLLMSNYPTIIS
jgi:hypothetical protein